MSTPTKKPRTAAGKRSRLYWAVPAVLGGLVLVVLVAKWLMGLPAVASFVADYPGHSELPDNAPVGFPAADHPHGVAGADHGPPQRTLDPEQQGPDQDEEPANQDQP